MKLYVIGSLRNPAIIPITNNLVKAGFDVFSDWMAAGPEADDYWQKYEKARGRTYIEALKSPAAQNVVQFDKKHLDQAEAGILVYPAGRSGHTEMGYMLGQKKKVYLLLDKEPAPDVRWDVMVLLSSGVFLDLNDIIQELKKSKEHAHTWIDIPYSDPVSMWCSGCDEVMVGG